MCDDWEDWENEDFVVPTFVPNEEQLKRLEERKLVEESDAKIARELFEFDDVEDLANKEIKKFSQQNININVIKPKRQKTVSNQKANEEKQQELARIKREQKAKKNRENELYGEAEEDEYADYEDKFY